MFGGLKSLAQPISDTIHRIRAVLSTVYNVLPAGAAIYNGIEYGGIKIRSKDAVYKIQIYHTGQNGYITSGTDAGSSSAGIYLQSGTGSRYIYVANGSHPQVSALAIGSSQTWIIEDTPKACITSFWLQQTPARSRVSSAVTNTTITPANITGLSHTLIAGRKYTGRLVLYAAVPTSADGIRIDFDGGTATMTSFVAQGILSDDTSTRKLARTTALATDITDTDLNGDGLITIELGFVCNAAGTFIPRIAKEADAAGATLTVLANSFLWLEDMP